MSLEQGTVTIIDSSDVEVFTSGNPGFVAQGTAAAVAGAWPILVTDGVDTAAVVTSSAAAAGADGLVVYLGDTITATFAGPTVCAVTSVAMSVVVATILAANAARLQAFIWNDGAQNVFVRLEAGATTALFTVRVSSKGFFELPSPGAYTGIITGITAAATATVLATECT